MAFHVQYRQGRRWVVLSVHSVRDAALDDVAGRVAFLVADGFKHADVVRDFLVRPVAALS